MGSLGPAVDLAWQCDPGGRVERRKGTLLSSSNYAPGNVTDGERAVAAAAAGCADGGRRGLVRAVCEVGRSGAARDDGGGPDSAVRPESPQCFVVLVEMILEGVGGRTRAVAALRRSSFSSAGGATTTGTRPPATYATGRSAGSRSAKPKVSFRKSRTNRRVERRVLDLTEGVEVGLADAERGGDFLAEGQPLADAITTVTRLRGVSAGAEISMPRPRGAPAIVAPWQSKTTSEATIRTPPVHVQEGSRRELSRTVRRRSAWEQSKTGISSCATAIAETATRKSAERRDAVRTTMDGGRRVMCLRRDFCRSRADEVPRRGAAWLHRDPPAIAVRTAAAPVWRKSLLIDAHPPTTEIRQGETACPVNPT